MRINIAEFMNSDCSICYLSLDVEENYVITDCKHKFHFSCLIQWIMKNENCPMCRKSWSSFDWLQDWCRMWISEEKKYI